MPTLTKHAPGSFCWIELATTDPDGARAFYTGLFGYEVLETPLAEGAVYTTLKLGGRDAAALFRMRPQDYPAGTPPHWMTYLAAAEVAPATAKVAASGGKILREPFDVMDYGRMSVVQDAIGATFCLWQPVKHFGLGVTHEPGALAWCQLNVPLTAGEKAQEFYTKAFDWGFREDPMGMGMVYTTWLADDEPRGGMMPMPPGVNAPAHWLVYLAAPDVDGTAAKAKTLGGKVLVPPTDIPGAGRFAVIADPQGATFAVVNFTTPMV
jgi:predicted enzyme related to lactoylglutathione lyase